MSLTGRLLPIAVLHLGGDTGAAAATATGRVVPLFSWEETGAVDPLSWEDAYAKADLTLAQMAPGEKNQVLRGIGWDGWQLAKWWYVGNTAGVTRLGVPSLNMMDSSAGFRTYWSELVGTVTCWPSLLSLSATWNPGTVLEYASAVGKEFAGKGANAILGPGVEVQRVARNGRNFEYLSGEDPFLGSKLAAAYVKGVESQGVMAVMKHFAFNHQETNRGSENSIVDKKTAWELYYPPFQASVDAGVSAAMCSYNEVDGKFSCSSTELLQKDLKETMGFRGFVQSDWWALHNNYSLAMGLDQDMPGVGAESSIYTAGVPATNQLMAETPGSADGAVRRILAAMYRLKLDSRTRCTPPYCRAWMERNVTSEEHAQLARRVAAESVVLLKNEGALLPLRPSPATRRVAIIGAAAVAEAYDPQGAGQGREHAWRYGDYYSGGGSGHVVAGNVVTPLAGLEARARSLGVEVIASPSNSVSAAIQAAREADVAIVVAATTSGESVDRSNLHLDDDSDALIEAVAAQTNNTVVLLQVPGAVLMPWRHSVSSILTMFLAGQMTGAAWADVVFGDHAPTGRLPIMMPATAEDTIPPSTSLEIHYKEGLATSYRNRNFTASFPFGHGLTYSTFNYSGASQIPCHPNITKAALCVQLQVVNSGNNTAGTIVQLYIEFASVAGHPAPFLKGFERTGLLPPGSSTLVTFELSLRDLSYFKESLGGWVLTPFATAHFAESSEDIRQTLQLALDGITTTTSSTMASATSTAGTSGGDDSMSRSGHGAVASNAMFFFCLLSLLQTSR
eukprot:TRINITY_DN27617_c0_g1_i1.p1 TRINITY_DN27617_c0_g1~~TRINITY_DN27617_c0_g1_i1.p1  ORF type:complete len:819 (+),score=155.49 TRINITY_DN27617_c0_g1_i1:86-2458(+)